MVKDIYVFGDLICTDKDVALFKHNHMNDLVGQELAEIIQNEDNQIIINLEGPITSSREMIPKGGSPNLKSDPYIMNLLSTIPNLLISGANNHITDYGKEGLIDTNRLLNSASIPHIGFGTNKTELEETYSFSVEQKKAIVISVAQNEFCTIDSYSKYVGATPYNPLTTFDDISAKKEQNVLLIVLFHGGKENYRYPTPFQRLICKKMIDSGADIVICQHSHCVGCMEEYRNGTIVYGTGNFLFNISNNELWTTSIVPHIRIAPDNSFIIDYIPLKKNDHGVEIAKGEESEEIIRGFEERSQNVLLDGFIEKEWNKYCDDFRYTILWNGFFRFPRFLYWIDRLTNRAVSKYILNNWPKNLTTYNYIRCEAINEMCQTILRNIENERLSKQGK